MLRRGILDGTGSLLICMFAAYYTLLKYAKLWELEHSRTLAVRRAESARDNRISDLEEYQPEPVFGHAARTNEESGQESMAPAA